MTTTTTPAILVNKLDKPLVSWGFIHQFDDSSVRTRVRYWPGSTTSQKPSSDRYEFIITFSKSEMVELVNRKYGESIDDPSPVGGVNIKNNYDLVLACGTAARYQDLLKATIERDFTLEYAKNPHDGIADFPTYKKSLMEQMAMCDAFVKFMSNFKLSPTFEAIQEINALLA